MWGLVRLDFGTSMWTGAPILEEIKLRFALSLQLAIMATAVGVLIALPLGVAAALKQDTWIDYLARVVSIAGIATPSFWLGILMILTLLVVFHWLPPMVYTPFWVNPWQNMLQLIWPALAVGYRLLGGGHPHDPLGHAGGAARGLHPHRARQGPGGNAHPQAPRAQERACCRCLTVTGIEFAFLMGGLVVTEQVFNLNGLGPALRAGGHPARLHA